MPISNITGPSVITTTVNQANTNLSDTAHANPLTFDYQTPSSAATITSLSKRSSNPAVKTIL